MIEQCMEMMRGMGGMMGNGMMGGMMLMMFLGALLVLSLAVGGILLLVRRFSGRQARGSQSALSILQERFARGEIEREEYQERLLTLQGQH